MRSYRKEQHNLKNQILETSSQLKRCLTNIIYITILHQVNKAIKSKIKAASARKPKKLEKISVRPSKQCFTKKE